MPSAMPFTGLPKTSTSPSLGGSSPEISARVVDLPHPVGPTTAQNSPGLTSRLRSRNAVYTPPDGVRNRFVTPRSSIAEDIKVGLCVVLVASTIHAVVVAVLVFLVAAQRLAQAVRSIRIRPVKTR